MLVNYSVHCRKLCGKEEPVYQAILAENMDFDEVLISPTMINDHMPDNVLEALQKVMKTWCLKSSLQSPGIYFVGMWVSLIFFANVFQMHCWFPCCI